MFAPSSRPAQSHASAPRKFATAESRVVIPHAALLTALLTTISARAIVSGTDNPSYTDTEFTEFVGMGGCRGDIPTKFTFGGKLLWTALLLGAACGRTPRRRPLILLASVGLGATLGTRRSGGSRWRMKWLGGNNAIAIQSKVTP